MASIESPARKSHKPRSGRGQGGRRPRRMRWFQDMLAEMQSPASPQAPPALVDVGAQLRALRVQNGLSMRLLAERSGLNVNTLGLIENGKTSPSVSTLQQIALALNVPITAFFEQDAVSKNIVFQKKDQRPQALFHHGALEDLGSGVMLGGGHPLLVTLQPGADSGPAPIMHSGFEFVFCLEGRLGYTIEDQHYLLEPGDSLLFESQLPHRWENPGDVVLHSLLIVCPHTDTERATELHFSPLEL
jgi:transcriptional regulator with XRE-family HTH domain